MKIWHKIGLIDLGIHYPTYLQRGLPSATVLSIPECSRNPFDDCKSSSSRSSDIFRTANSRIKAASHSSNTISGRSYCATRRATGGRDAVLTHVRTKGSTRCELHLQSHASTRSRALADSLNLAARLDTDVISQSRASTCTSGNGPPSTDDASAPCLLSASFFGVFPASACAPVRVGCEVLPELPEDICLVGGDVLLDPRRQRHGRHARDATAQLGQRRSARGAGSMGRIASGRPAAKRARARRLLCSYTARRVAA